jgi:hypothetical protein
MEVYSTSAGFADEWLFAEPSGTLTSVQRRQRLNGGAVHFAPRLDRSQSDSDVRFPLGFEDGDGFIACGYLPLQIARETRRNTNLDNSRANVSVRLDVFAHRQ